MFAWETARTWWEEHSTEPFETRLGWHFSCGLVYSSPSAFLLASEVSWDPVSRAILQTSDFRLQPLHNAWFLELAVSQGAPLSLFMQIAPRPHDWILFRRNNGFRIHAYRWARMARLLKFPPTPTFSLQPSV